MVQRTVNVEELYVLLCSTDSLIRVLPDDCQLFMHRRSVTLLYTHYSTLEVKGTWLVRHHCIASWCSDRPNTLFVSWGSRREVILATSAKRLHGLVVALYCRHVLHCRKKQLIFHIRSPSTVSFRGWKVTTACTSDPFERNALHLYNSQTQIQRAIIEFL